MELGGRETERRMTFTATVPTNPGAYWWKDGAEATPTLIEVRSRKGRLECFGDGTSNWSVEHMGINGSLWCRLVAVEEIEKAFFEGFKAFNDTQWPNTKRVEIWNSSRAKKVSEGTE